jgi:protein-S-isoprenylcysteine O-methyltransferase Ste14
MQAAGTTINPSPLPRPSSHPACFVSRATRYFALTLLYLGLTLAVNTWWGIVVLIPLVAVMHRGVVLREERYLGQKFGEGYRRYRSSVRRYL